VINASLPDQIELAICAGAARALRTRAAVQRQMAADGTSSAGDRFPTIVVRSPEAAMAANLADAFLRIADGIEAEAPL
jgi:hypothetical protein